LSPRRKREEKARKKEREKEREGESFSKATLKCLEHAIMSSPHECLNSNSFLFLFVLSHWKVSQGFDSFQRKVEGSSKRPQLVEEKE